MQQIDVTHITKSSSGFLRVFGGPVTKAFENDCPNQSSERLLTEKTVSSISLLFPGSLVKTSCLWDKIV